MKKLIKNVHFNVIKDNFSVMKNMKFEVYIWKYYIENILDKIKHSKLLFANIYII